MSLSRHTYILALVENVWWFDLNFLSRTRVVIIVPRMQLSNLFSICYSICCVALSSSCQQRSLIIKTSVASDRSGNLPDFSCLPWAKAAGDILPSWKLTNHLSSFVSRFFVAQFLKEHSTVAYSSCFRTKIANLTFLIWNVRWAMKSQSTQLKVAMSPWFHFVSDKKFKSNHQTFSAGGMDGWTRDYCLF